MVHGFSRANRTIRARTSRPIGGRPWRRGLRPAIRYQAPVPVQQGRWRDQERRPPDARQESARRGQEESIRRPAHFTMARPVITGAPASAAYGSVFQIQTPSPASIAEVVLLRPGAVTHGFNMTQRLVECAIVGTNPGNVQVQAPPDGNIAPPGHYLLFILTAGRAPSLGRWIRIT